MVNTQACYTYHMRLNYVGAVQPAAESGLDNRDINFFIDEMHKRQCRHNFKKARRVGLGKFLHRCMNPVDKFKHLAFCNFL